MKTELDSGVTVFLPEDEIEDEVREQLNEMGNHEAFDAESARVMPDTHWGKGAAIGFTMPIQDRVVPNTIGVDIGCFTPETEVATLEGDRRIDELCDEGEFYVYSSETDGTIQPAKATAMKTRIDEDLVRVTLDNGEEIECTPDHEFMCRDGSFVEAENLSSGQSLMPLYRYETDEGYEMILNNKTKNTILTHWMVARSSHMDIPDVDDPIIHHSDFNKRNNSPDNLRIMERDEHSSLHRELSDGEHWQSEEFERRRIAALRDREPTDREIEAAVENITTYMDENPDHFEEVVSENGERGKEYLKDFNTSERECDVCGDVLENPAKEYWHQVKNHPNTTEYAIRENHTVESVESVDRTSDVYCLNVPEYGNFALSSGVFVHNCGMNCAYLDGDAYRWEDDEYTERVDREIRERIPMGRETRNNPVMHLVNEFPWDECEEKLDSLQETIGFEETPDWFDGYGEEYFHELCNRVEYDPMRAINSLGTLGGGNHFIEIGERSDGGVAVTLHSGSRGIGLSIAQYHQNRATEQMFRERNLVTIPESEVTYFEGEGLVDKTPDGDGSMYAKPGDLSIDRDAVLEDYDGEAIEGKFGQLKSYLNAGKNDSHPLDYLEGEEAVGYYIDMIFAQTYASESRKAMIIDVADVLDMGITYRIESVHNYIDFEDGIIRKGATRAHEGEYAIIPYNMRDGTIIVRGKGNEEWNYSAPHGAGRVMSRTKARDLFDEDELREEMDGIATSVIPLDEAPGAYKEYSLIEDAIEPTAEIVDRITPLQNLKADE